MSALMERGPSPFVDIEFRHQFAPYLHPYAVAGSVHLSANVVGGRFGVDLSPKQARHLAEVLLAEASVAEGQA